MADCPHGEIHPSACMDCLDGVPEPRQKWTASRSTAAEFPAFCARDDGHIIQAGQLIYLVAGEGWCCGQCAHVPLQSHLTELVQLGVLTLEFDETPFEWRGTGTVIDDVQVLTANGITQLWCKTCGAVVEKPAEQINVKQEIQGHHARGCPF